MDGPPLGAEREGSHRGASIVSVMIILLSGEEGENEAKNPWLKRKPKTCQKPWRPAPDSTGHPLRPVQAQQQSSVEFLHDFLYLQSDDILMYSL